MDTPQVLDLIRMCVLFALLVVCAYTDLSYGKLYNWATLPAMSLGLFGFFLQGHLLEGSYFSILFINSLLGLVIGMGLFLILYASGGFGAGDMKLAGAIGALTGWHFALTAFVYSSLVGAMMALGVLIWHGKFFSGIKNSLGLLFTIDKSKYAEEKKAEEILITIPYGLAISIGTLWAWFMEFLARGGGIG